MEWFTMRMNEKYEKILTGIAFAVVLFIIMAADSIAEFVARHIF